MHEYELLHVRGRSAACSLINKNFKIHSNGSLSWDDDCRCIYPQLRQYMLSAILRKDLFSAEVYNLSNNNDVRSVRNVSCRSRVLFLVAIYA